MMNPKSIKINHIITEKFKTEQIYFVVPNKKNRNNDSKKETDEVFIENEADNFSKTEEEFCIKKDGDLPLEDDVFEDEKMNLLCLSAELCEELENFGGKNIHQFVKSESSIPDNEDAKNPDKEELNIEKYKGIEQILSSHESEVDIYKHDSEPGCLVSECSSVGQLKECMKVENEFKEIPLLEYSDPHLEKTVHDSDKFACDHCNFCTPFEKELKFHISSSHVSNSQICTVSNQTKSDDYQPFDLKTKNFKCSICDYKTCFNGNLTKHMNQVHLICSECGYRSNVKNVMKNHINAIHLKLKPFGCSECHLKFRSRGGLRYHMETIHLRIKLYECTECEFKSGKKWIVTDHINTVHLKWKFY